MQMATTNTSTIKKKSFEKDEYVYRLASPWIQMQNEAKTLLTYFYLQLTFLISSLLPLTAIISTFRCSPSIHSFLFYLSLFVSLLQSCCSSLYICCMCRAMVAFCNLLWTHQLSSNMLLHFGLFISSFLVSDVNVLYYCLLTPFFDFFFPFFSNKNHCF